MISPAKRKGSSLSDDGSPSEKRLKPDDSNIAPPPSQSELPLDVTEADEKPFRFLDLASELRNAIYEKVLEDHPAKLFHSSSRRKLASSSALARVNRQLHDEFLGYAIVAAPVIETTVVDFRFGHIITFLNNLSDEDLEKLTKPQKGSAEDRTATEPPERIISVNLKFNDVPLLDQLNRWLNRAGHPTKKGANIKFQYHCGPANPHMYLAECPRHRNLTDIMRGGQSGGRRNEEARKIIKVLEDAHAAYDAINRIHPRSFSGIWRTWPWTRA